MDSNDAQPTVDPPAADPEAEESAAAQRWRAIEQERAAKQKKVRPFWVELPILLVIAFVMTFLIQTFLFKVYYIPSGSMEKTLHGVSEGGDRVLVNKVVYDFSEPSPGEVVVFSGPATWAVEATIPGPTTWYGNFFQAVGSVVGIAPPNEKDFVKRVIATAGQTVECCDADGHVMVDGKALDEPYIYQDWDFTPGSNDCTTVIRAERCFGPVEVPANSLWVMGDHRSGSKDSSWGCRANAAPTDCQGPIPVGNVIGHVVFIVMPVSRWSGIGSPDIQGSLILAVGAFSALPRHKSRHRLRRSRWPHR